jgi:hypothetical protein
MKAYATKANATNFSNEDDLQWKTTSNGRLTQISKVKQTTTGQILHNVLTKPNFTNVSITDNLQRMTTSNMKSEISQQNPVGSSSNQKCKLS